jgi:hypothetical protein
VEDDIITEHSALWKTLSVKDFTGDFPIDADSECFCGVSLRLNMLAYNIGSTETSLVIQTKNFSAVQFLARGRGGG